MPLYETAPMTVDDIVTLWDGTPDGTQFLRDDGTLAHPLPDASGSDEGDVLTLDGDLLPVWAPAAGGGLAPIDSNGDAIGINADPDGYSAVIVLKPTLSYSQLIRFVGVGGVANPLCAWEGADGSVGHVGFALGGFQWSDGGGTTVFLVPGYPTSRWHGHSSLPARTEWASYDGSSHVVVAYHIAGRAFDTAPPSAPSDALIDEGAYTAYFDEVADELIFRARYSDGTLKTGVVALV